MVVVFTNDFTIDPFQIIIFLSMSCANQGFNELCKSRLNYGLARAALVACKCSWTGMLTI
jgi:hypothetical protein